MGAALPGCVPVSGTSFTFLSDFYFLASCCRPPVKSVLHGIDPAPCIFPGFEEPEKDRRQVCFCVSRRLSGLSRSNFGVHTPIYSYLSDLNSSVSPSHLNGYASEPSFCTRSNPAANSSQSDADASACTTSIRSYRTAS